MFSADTDRKSMEDSLVDSEGLISLSMLKAEEQASGEQEKDEEVKKDKEAEEAGEAEDDNKKGEHSHGGGLIDRLASSLMVSIPGFSPRETEEDRQRENGALGGGGLTTNQLVTNLPVSKQDEPFLSADEVSLLISIIED